MTSSASAMLLGLLSTSGCRDLQERANADDSGCTAESIPSVLAATFDGIGLPLVPDAVTWSVAGSDELAADCVAMPCDQWVAGWEVVGSITVTATHLDEGCTDPAQDSVTVDVALDPTGCHVQQQDVRLVLDALDCGWP